MLLQLWDPQTGSCVVQYELGKNGGVVTAVQSLGHPYSNYLIAATSESTLRLGFSSPIFNISPLYSNAEGFCV